MIKIAFYSKDNSYIGIQIAGHAGYAPSGKDIVCSAVSSLYISTVNAIEKYTDDKFINETTEGSVKFKIVGDVSHDSELLLKSFRDAVIRIYEEYGDKYLRLYFKEV